MSIGTGAVLSVSMNLSSMDAVLTRAGVAFAYLFGSRATGRHCAGSDADVGIKVERPLRLLEEVALASALGVPAVDLVDLDRAPLRLKGRIVQEGKLLFRADEPARVAFEVRTRSEYFDFRPTLDTHRRLFLQRVAAGGLDG
jgi:predicted nucleotidyltransferase